MTLLLERAYPTPMSNSALIPLLLLSLAKQRHTPNASRRIKREYDYVIVGGGSAGSVVASRLSEKSCVSVLLLEAGGQPPLLTEVPALSRYFWFTDVDWKYKTVPQKYTGKALVNRQVPFSRGKMLGGSSSLNDMVYVRGNRKNYDDWEAEGAKRWSYKDVFPYFLKLENNKDYSFLRNGYHSRGGPVTVHQPRYESELKRAVYKAATDLGYKIVDSNAARQTGFYEHQATLRDNQRCSTAKAYLVPAENRTNFDILPKAMATKIIIKGRRARGVRFDFRGHTYVVRAKREVIVSAGALSTPQLLMLSGIGPKRELQKLNIPVVADLPVGENLQDHGRVPFPYVLNSDIPNFEEKITDADNIEQYIHNRTGPLASASGVFVAFLKGDSKQPQVDFPNYALEFGEATTSIARTKFGLKPEVYRKLYGPYEKEPLFMCSVSQLQPKSRGRVSLRSKSPYDRPNIDPNYLADPKDVEDLVEGMKTCQKLSDSRHLQRLGVRPFKTLVPGCEKFAYDEEDYFRCYVRFILVTIHHPVGTAKMGDPWDPSTVVDPKLRVKSIKGLRVVDASIMPIIPSGNTNIPTIMVAEKASDIIKENINCYKSWEEKPPESSEWSSEEDVDNEKWEDKEHWKDPGDKEIIWVEDDEDWEKPKDKESIWVEHTDEWEKPKDEEIVWEDDDEEQSEKPKDKEVMWEDEVKQWGKPKDKETVWFPKEEQWEKPKDKESSWQDEERQWEKPKDKESVWFPKEHQWEKTQNKETVWLKNQYPHTELVKDEWDGTDKISWPKEEKKPLGDYFKPPVQIPLPKSKNDYTKTYDDVTQQPSWTHDVKQPEHLPLRDKAKSTDKPENLPYSWYKKQTDLHLQKYKELNEKTESSTPWKELQDYKTEKNVKELSKLAEWKDLEEKPGAAWQDSDYRETESIEELVKLAERDAGSPTLNNPWKESGSYGVTKSLDELVKLAHTTPEPSTEYWGKTITSPKIRWY